MAVMQGTTQPQQTEVSAFEAERTRLVTDIKLEMSQMVTNMTILQRNLDTIITIGQEFDQLSHLWKNFHASSFQLASEEELAQSQDI
ncbi:hypothetical protein BGZ76_008145 [Entomortierella beljakovae]|nr:hypothetical protein BGZ76_008145 [Entomortierella beljakovae]